MLIPNVSIWRKTCRNTKSPTSTLKLVQIKNIKFAKVVEIVETCKEGYQFVIPILCKMAYLILSLMAYS